MFGDISLRELVWWLEYCDILYLDKNLFIKGNLFTFGLHILLWGFYTLVKIILMIHENFTKIRKTFSNVDFSWIFINIMDQYFSSVRSKKHKKIKYILPSNYFANYIWIMQIVVVSKSGLHVSFTNVDFNLHNFF